MKKYVLGIIAIVVAIAGSAFTAADKGVKKVDGQLWYEFVGTDPGDAADYFIIGDGTVAPLCDAQTQNRCAVLAIPNQTLGEDFPDLGDPDKVIRNKQ